MGKIVVSENVTLDGVVQDPTGDEGCTFGGWFDPATAEDREAWAKVEFEEALGARALLLGRRTYEWFASRWISRPGEWADRLRSLPKYVVSSTLDEFEWNNSTLLKGDIVAEISTLKENVDGDIVVYASGRLVRTLMERDLVDELRLMTHPYVLGAGARLFGPTRAPRTMRLADARVVGNGLALLTYQRPENA